jgi:pyrimidine operon attenuation protein / uracil phosphoribosyltransferase
VDLTEPSDQRARERVEVLGAADVQRAITRIAHEISERNHGLADVVLVGLQRGGTEPARALGAALARVDPDHRVPIGLLDVSLHRDDIGLRPVTPSAASDVPFDVSGVVVVIVDDVLYTGRTVRAALDAVHDYGRPRAVQLAVLVDRGHRELPIRPDYVGKNLPTATDEEVEASVDGIAILRPVVRPNP